MMHCTLSQPRLRPACIIPRAGLRSRSRAGSCSPRFTCAVATSSDNASLDWASLPGPKGLPIVGNLPDLKRQDFHKVLAGWGAQWKIFKFSVLNQEFCVITDPVESSRLLSILPGGDLPKAGTYAKQQGAFTPTPGKVIDYFTAAEHSIWKTIRDGIDPAFTPAKAKEAHPQIKAIVAEVLDKVATLIPKGGAEGVEMVDPAQRYALDIMGLCVMGTDYRCRKFEGGNFEFVKCVALSVTEIMKMASDPVHAFKIQKLGWTEEARAYWTAQQKVYDSLAEFGRKAAAARAAGKANDDSMASLLSKVKNPLTNELLTAEEIAANAGATLLGGFESPAYAATWSLFLLATHPEVQAKLADELKAAGLAWSNGKPGREVTLEDLKLPYLNKVWKETIRMYPSAANATVRKAAVDLQLTNGLVIPKGTVVMLPVYAHHHSPHNFVDHDKYWPERWDHHNDNAQGVGGAAGGGCPFASLSGNTAANSYIPYQYPQGTRNCIGRHLAEVQGLTWLAMFIGRFQVEGLAPKMGTYEDVRNAEKTLLTVQPGNGMWLKLKQR